jgi:hypothetical protein
MEPEFSRLYERVQTYTMTSIERTYGLFKAVEYLVHNDIPGDIVACGVWKGGSTMTAAHALLACGGRMKRTLYLYDTFEGMTEPTQQDVDFMGKHARST